MALATTRAPFWSLANARKVLGYEPEDDSEVKFAKDIQGFLVATGRQAGSVGSGGERHGHVNGDKPGGTLESHQG